MICILVHNNIVKNVTLTARYAYHLQRSSHDLVIYQVVMDRVPSGEMFSKLRKELMKEPEFNGEKIKYYEDRYQIKLKKLRLIDILLGNPIVELRNGDTARISSMDRDSEFLYTIEGVCRDNGYWYSWTSDGFYYNENNPDGRDIVGVVSW